MLPRGHRLAGAKRCARATSPTRCSSRSPTPARRSGATSGCWSTSSGHRPPISPYVGDKLEDWLHLIGRGEGIDTSPAIIARYYAWPELAYVPLHDAAPATLALARRRDVEHPLTDEVTELALDIAAQAGLRAETEA